MVFTKNSMRQRGAWPRRCAGSVLIITLLIVLALATLAVVLARSVRVEALAVSNRLASAQAAAAAEGAAAAVLALGDELPSDVIPVGTQDADTDDDAALTSVAWLLRPNFDDDTTYAFGLTHEAGKVNINTAPADMLLRLPWMTEEIVAAILDWRDADDEPTPSGAESDYYLSLPEPYLAKNDAFETIEELLLVRGITARELYGEDANRNGVLDPNEDDGEVLDPPDNADGKLDRGLIDFVTVYSREPDTAPDGQERVDVNRVQDTDRLAQLAQQLLPADRATQAVAAIASHRPYQNLIELFLETELPEEDFAVLEPYLTCSVLPGQDGGNPAQMSPSRIDINTAPREVLLALPGLDESDVDALLAYRAGAADASATGDQAGGDLSSIAWITRVLDREKAIAVGGLVTTRSYQRAADIVAAAPRGRGFERYRLVYDTSSDPPRVLLWQRLTHLGWPLEPELLDQLRAGASVSELMQTTDRGGL